MSGRTRKNVSVFTVNSLHIHLTAILAEAEKRNTQRFEAQENAVTAALTAAKEAVVKAEMAAEKRFDSVNEFRGQQKDMIATFMPRAEVEVIVKGLNDQVTALTGRQDKTEGASLGRGAVWASIGVVVGIVIAAIALVMRTINR